MAPLERIQRMRGLFLQHSTRPRSCSLTDAVSLAVHSSHRWLVVRTNSNYSLLSLASDRSDMPEALVFVSEVDVGTS